MGSLVYYSSSSGNTARFVEKLGLTAIRLPASNQEPLPALTKPFVLVCPTFSDNSGRGAVPKSVIRALNETQIRRKLRGVIAAGNRNFGVNFALSGRVISRKCLVPVLYRFELAGTPNDVNKVTQGLELFWKQIL